MSFGFPLRLANRNIFWKIIYRIFHTLFGWPNYLRRLQWPTFNTNLAIDRGMTVLDIGAGDFQYSVELAKQHAEVIVLDLCLEKNDLEMISGKYDIRGVVADALFLPFRSESFDRVLLSSVLQMVSDPEMLLRECGRVLKPGARIVFSVPNNYQYIPRFIQNKSKLSNAVKKWLRTPESISCLEATLNKHFHVGGPTGYYSYEKLYNLIHKSGLTIVNHNYSPGLVGSLIWEIGILLYLRYGGIVFHILFLLYPLALLSDKLFKNSEGSEHIVTVVKKND